MAKKRNRRPPVAAVEAVGIALPTAPDNIHFVGEPRFRPPPAFADVSVPERFREHPLLRGRLFLTLPSNLLNAIQTSLGPGCFDSDLMALELELAEFSGDHSFRVGFWNYAPIMYTLLRPPTPIVLAAGDAASMGINPAAAAHALRTIKQRIAHFATHARGYAGWLMTNREYLQERDHLLGAWVGQVANWGLRTVGLVIPEGFSSSELNPTAHPDWARFEAAFHQFFVRWRLLGMAAPELPIPMQPMMGGDFPMSILPQLIRAGGLFNLPDTVPIPSRDELRGMLKDALHSGDSPEHLREWMRMIGTHYPAKHKIARLARIFEMQHYWRLLHQRHPAALVGNLHRLRLVLADFLGCSEPAVKSDLILIGKRLGPDWLDRGVAGTA